MISTEEHPLAFFDWYLENEINKDFLLEPNYTPKDIILEKYNYTI
jgi:hypothetical protein